MNCNNSNTNNIFIQLKRKFFGHSQSSFLVKCSFGGINDDFILCGSENAYLYIWTKNNSLPVLSIKSHSGRVNSVIWPSFVNNKSSNKFNNNKSIQNLLDNNTSDKLKFMPCVISSSQDQSINFYQIGDSSILDNNLISVDLNNI